MSNEPLTATIKAAMKAAMKAREKERLGTIRLILSEFKRIEVDERIEVDDARALVVLDKMVKQRRDSADQFQNAGCSSDLASCSIRFARSSGWIRTRSIARCGSAIRSTARARPMGGS